jgi:hypothetical protein
MNNLSIEKLKKLKKIKNNSNTEIELPIEIIEKQYVTESGKLLLKD